MNEPKTDYEALVLALYLAVTANTKRRTDLAIEMVHKLAPQVSEIEYARAKREVEKRIEEETR